MEKRNLLMYVKFKGNKSSTRTFVDDKELQKYWDVLRKEQAGNIELRKIYRLEKSYRMVKKKTNLST